MFIYAMIIFIPPQSSGHDIMITCRINMRCYVW